VCRVGKDGKGDSLGDDPTPAAESAPAPKPEPVADPVDPDVAGEVFSNL
jgi:hypothetical protein